MILNRYNWLLTKTVTYGTCALSKPCSIGVHLWFTLPESGTKNTQFLMSAIQRKRTLDVTVKIERGT